MVRRAEQNARIYIRAVFARAYTKHARLGALPPQKLIAARAVRISVGNFGAQIVLGGTGEMEMRLRATDDSNRACIIADTFFAYFTQSPWAELWKIEPKKVAQSNGNIKRFSSWCGADVGGTAPDINWQIGVTTQDTGRMFFLWIEPNFKQIRLVRRETTGVDYTICTWKATG